MADLKLLIHVPDSKRFEPVLKITKNSVLAMEEGKNFKIRIFANFEGITVFNDFSRFEALFREALEKGVKVYFCEDALKGFNIFFKKFPKGEKIVSGGIVALVEWQ